MMILLKQTTSFLALSICVLCATCQPNSTPAKLLFFNRVLKDSIPKPHGFTNDFEDIYSNKEEKILDSLIAGFEKETSIQIAIVSIDTTMTTREGFDNFTLELAKKWGAGLAVKNNGVLIGVSKGFRIMRIQNGYGIEEILSDKETKEIVDNSFISHFKKGEYFIGTYEGTKALIAKLRTKIAR
jgi:uncharacterized protein